MAQRMILNETSWFGSGCVSVLADEIARRGWQHAFLVTDRALPGVGPVEAVEAVLAKAGTPVTRYAEVKPNPTIANVQQGLAAFRASGADFLVAVGGGSAMDTAKGIAVIAANPEFEDVRSLEGLSPTGKPCKPVVAIPTTAGTAAEVTINYVITDEEKRRKFVCVDPHDIPCVAIVDAGLMASMPKALAASTGLDALTHAIEGFITLGAWEMSDMMTLKAIELIGANLRAAVLEGSAPAREKIALAQYVAGMGFSNVGLGLVHAMAHPLGAFYDTPHGVANALLLPGIMEFNAPACGEKYRTIARALGVVGTEAMTPAQYAAAACGAVRRLALDLAIPQKLSAIGAKEADLPALAAAAFADVCRPGNPRPVTQAEILGLYREAF